MLNQVKISDDLLEIVNTKIPGFSDQPDRFGVLVVLVGIVSLAALIGTLLYRFLGAEDMGREIESFRRRLARVWRSTLLTRLCIYWAAIVIPLIFYVNTKEHYWTAKHTTMLFSGFLGLFSWLAVSIRVPRFRTPYVWPVSIILLSATLSTFCAVNMAESIGYLFAIFGSAVFFFLASQVLSTTKRIHLFVVILVVVAGIMSTYGLAQAYLLLPMDYVFAHDTRAPVSTIGNKNYAAYFLDLTIPLAFVLAVCRRNSWQTLLALGGFYLCHWHFVLCDTRGGTIAMILGIAVTTAVVAVYHGRRFRLLLYVVLIEPLLWAAMNLAKITYSDTQGWGQVLLGRRFRGAVTRALNEALPEDLKASSVFIRNWFFDGNDAVLGIHLRLGALVTGFLLALFLFWLVLRLKDSKRDWPVHLGAAAALALLPYLFAIGTMPGKMPANKLANEVVEAVARSDLSHRDYAVQTLRQFAPRMAEAVGPYNELLLDKHRNVAAVMSFTLFACLATFLLFRWYDKKEGWAPGFAVVGALGGWFLLFLLLRSGGDIPSKLFGGLFEKINFLWTKDLRPIHAGSSILSFLFRTVWFLAFSLGGLLSVVWAMQFIPAHHSREETRRIAERGIQVGKIFAGVLLVLVLIAGWFNPRIRRVRSEMARTYSELKDHKGRVIDTLFAGAHTFFNTEAKFEDQAPDGAIGFRLEIYQACLRKVLDNPILGIGPGNFKVIHPYPKYETALERRILGKEVLGRKAHNDFLEDLVENGVFGFLGLVWMFTLTGYLLYRSLKEIRSPRNATDTFLNSVTWGLSWSMLAILVHAQFEAPLLQPASTYPCWMLFGVVFQVYRLHRRRRLATENPDGLSPTVVTSRIRETPGLPPTPAAFELPEPVPPVDERLAGILDPKIAWPTVAVVVTLVTGTVLLRQFVGEMWLRWGMIFSESGVEKYEYVFECMEKASEVYPQQMETNYITGRYCIDAVQKVYRPWSIKTRTDLYDARRRKANQKTIEEIRKTYQLDVDRILEYAHLGLDVHKRDIYMNPHYKWAHNNMGVLCDKLSLIYSDLAAVEVDPEKRAEYERLAVRYEEESKKCYSKALEIDDLQVYALFNLGIGAFTKDHNFALAEKYFERTMLADPRKGDVNVFIAKCRFGLGDMEGVVDSAEKLFAWLDESRRNRLDSIQKEEMESVLSQAALVTLQSGTAEVSARAYKILSERYDRCRYLPMYARATLESGSPEGALEIAAQALTECRERPSAEAVFVQTKAGCLIGDASKALEAFNLLVRSNAAAAFRDRFEKDPAFDLIREKEPFRKFLEIHRPAPKKTEPEDPAGGEPKPESGKN